MQALIVITGALGLSLLGGRPAHGQEILESGDRVRLTVPGLYTNFAATFLAVDGDSLRVRSRRLEIAIPVDAVASIERSVSRRPRIEGVLIGGGGGAAAGWFVGSFMGLCDTVDSVAPDSGDCVPIVVASFAAGGALVGLLFALTNPAEKWAPASLPPALGTLGRLGFSVDPERGATVHVSAIRFRF